MTARDVLYGRRAGRWAGPDVDVLLREMHLARLEALRHDRHLTAAAYDDPANREWPIESLPYWIAIADDPAHPRHIDAREVVELIRPEILETLR